VTRSVQQMLYALALIVTVPFLMGEAWGQTQTQPQTPQLHHVAGAIASVSDGSFVLTERGGQSVTVHMTSTTRLLRRQQATLADIKAGDAVRIIATKAPDGTLTARAVQDIGPGSQTQARRGEEAGETRSGKILVSGSVTGSPSGGVLTVASPDGKTTSVSVPQTARISRLVMAEAGSLTSGLRVLVEGSSNADGSVTATVIFVGGTQSK
jgi:hypothetical protein